MSDSPPAWPGRRVRVLDSWMTVSESGDGHPVLFLHGNPTSSFLWRHMIAARPCGRRCVAVDLIGMGDSGKPDIEYALADHIRYLDALVEELGLDNYTIVAHDWGVAIALDRLRRFPNQVRALAFMEGHMRPLPDWDAFDEGGRSLFQTLRIDGEGERMVLRENFFIDTLLPAGLMGTLGVDELTAYRSPYPTPASRRPLLAWARQIPVAGEPEQTVATMAEGVRHACASNVPKLLVQARPGAIVTAETVTWCRANLPALEVAEIEAPAGHFVPEDQPRAVSEAVWEWHQRVLPHDRPL